MGNAELAAPENAIREAAGRLDVRFPDPLVQVWSMANGFDLPGGWRFPPVFDAANPRKTCNDIVYENTKGRWEWMPQELVIIACGETGNRLVLRKSPDGQLQSDIQLWDHETNRIRKWSKDFAYIAQKASARVARIGKASQRSHRFAQTKGGSEKSE